MRTIWRTITGSRRVTGPAQAHGRAVSTPRYSVDFIAMSVFLAFLFIAGGGSRADMVSLVIIRPVAILLAAWWAVRLNGEHLAGHRWLLVIFGALFALVALHLVPLPSQVWRALPGHEIVALVDRTAGLGEVWRPLSIAPEAARNALLSLTVPLAVALGLLHLSRDERLGLLPILIGLAAASMFLSLAQDAAPGATALWLHRVTNAGDPVGLFANRNHNSVFLACLPLLLAIWAFDGVRSRHEALRKAVAAGLVLLTIVAIIVAGSRAGLIALGLTLAGSLLLLPTSAVTPKSARLARLATPIRAGAAAVLVILAALGVVYGLRSSGGGDAIDRLGTTSGEDFRIGFWQRTVSLVPDYLPLGSGAGSFVEAYQHGQPEETVGPNYVNHAHNDYLEVALTLGVPGILLLAAIFAFFLLCTWKVWRTPAEKRRNVFVARAASLCLGVLAIASIVDYPLRVPSIAAFATILAVWLAQPRNAPGKGATSAMAFPK